jgi:hypothetical protein
LLSKRFADATQRKISNAVGGDERDRTVGLLSAIQALSQLSYIPNTLNRSVERGAILRSGGRNATDRFR